MSINEAVETEQADKIETNCKPLCRYHDICRNYEKRDMYCNQYKGSHVGLDVTDGCRSLK